LTQSFPPRVPCQTSSLAYIITKEREGGLQKQRKEGGGKKKGSELKPQDLLVWPIAPGQGGKEEKKRREE